ncbi:MAG TPA: hypothetical protein ENN57_03265, partial [Chloroflexi bacterium]|nr:hypothetical protein [Chloroflexota bacterium]
MNILLTCAGRRNYLVHYFKEVLGKHGNVLAVDASPDAPALQEADQAFVLPRIDAPDYIETLLDLCQEKKINLLLSLNDLELPYLSANLSRFLAVSTIPVVSSSSVINTCFDKWLTCETLRSLGLKVPKTYLTFNAALYALESRDLHFPLVVKPRWGSASIGIMYPEDTEELQ